MFEYSLTVYIQAGSVLHLAVALFNSCWLNPIVFEEAINCNAVTYEICCSFFSWQQRSRRNRFIRIKPKHDVASNRVKALKQVECKYPCLSL